MPDMPQPRPQQAPARAHGCPSEEQPATLRQTLGPPEASVPHRSEQQSELERQGAPSFEQTSSAAHCPAVQ